LAGAFALGYAAGVRHIARTTLLWMQLGASLFMVAGIMASGWIADRHDGRTALLLGYGVVLGFAALLGPALSSGPPLLLFTCLALGFLAAGMTYGPLSGWLLQLFPPRVRYTGASLAFNLGGVLGGGLTPLVGQVLAVHGGVWRVGAYLAALVVVSVIALLLIRPAKAASGTDVVSVGPP
jgi:MFS family permease